MRKWIFVALPMLALIYSTCVHEVQVLPETPVDTATVVVPPSGGPLPGNTCSPDSVYFTNDILPLMTSNCSMNTCHGGRISPTLTTYDQIKRRRSDILEKINQGEMPIPPVAPLPSSQIALINKWFSQGAKNNSCAVACDTAKFTFTAIINPIVQRYCVGCHTGATSGNKNVDLSTYVGVRNVALDGRLYKSVAHLAGVTAMPPSGSISTCEVTQIKKWVAAGALN